MPIFDEVDALKSQVDSYRPIPPEKMELIDEKFTLEWTYHSNAIEGNTLSRQETAFFLKRGLTVQGKTMQEYLEVQNHVEAIESLKAIVKQDRRITQSLTKELHALLMHGIDFIWVGPKDNRVKRPLYPGKYKTEPNNVITMNGEVHHYCDPLLVPERMEKIVKLIQKGNSHPVQLAAIAHYELVAIHPFADGNGRVGRLLMNLILMQRGHPPAVIKNETKEEEYYRALMEGDKGDLESFVHLVATEVANSLQLMLDVLEGRTGITEGDLAKKLRNLDQKAKLLGNHVEMDKSAINEPINHVTDIACRSIQQPIDQNSLEKFRFTVWKGCPKKGSNIHLRSKYESVELPIKEGVKGGYTSGMHVEVYFRDRETLMDDKIFAHLLFPTFATTARRVYIASICCIGNNIAQVVGTASWELSSLIDEAVETEVRELFFRSLTFLESHLSN